MGDQINRAEVVFSAYAALAGSAVPARPGRTNSAMAALNLAGSSTNGSCPDSSNHESLFDGAVSASK